MSDLLPSTLPLDQQLVILRDALDHIAHWGDESADEPSSAARARRALRTAGYHYVPVEARPINRMSDAWPHAEIARTFNFTSR